MPPKMSCFSSLVEPMYVPHSVYVSAVRVSISDSGNILCTPERPDILRAHPLSYRVDIGHFFLEVKRPGRELTTAVHN